MHFSFPDITVKGKKLLTGGGFTLPDKGLFCLCGENGSGKTLLLNYLFEGKVKENVSALLMDQSGNRLLAKEDVLHNVSFSPHIDSETEKWFSHYHLEELLIHKSHELSGGEKRLICLLRLIRASADILFMDEPGNDLDFERVNLLVSLLEEKKREGLILVITHDDRLLALADGILKICHNQLESDDVVIEVYHDKEHPFPGEQAVLTNQSTVESAFFLKRQFSFDWAAMSLSVSFILLFLLISTGILKEGEKMGALIPENRIDIIHPLSSYYMLLKDECFPIIYGAYCHGEISDDVFIQILRQDEKGYSYITPSIVFPSEGSYDYIPLEYYNQESKELFFPKHSDDVALFLSDLPGSRAGSGREDWKALESDPDNSLFYLSIRLESGVDVRDFLGSSVFRTIWGEPLYIRTQETIALRNAMRTEHLRKQTFSQINVLVLISLMLEGTLAILYSFLIRRRIRIFRNMSYHAAFIRKNIMKKMAFGKIYLAGFVLLLICMTAEFLLIQGADRMIVTYLLCIWPALLYFPLVLGIKYAIFYTVVKTTADWRYR